MKKTYKHATDWGTYCDPPVLTSPNTNPKVTLLEIRTFKYMSGMSEYVFPELSSLDISKIKEGYQGTRILIIPVPKSRWIFNDSWTGWREEIKYIGGLGDTHEIPGDKGRYALVIPLEAIKELPGEQVRDLFTLVSTQSEKWEKEKGPDGTWGSPKLVGRKSRTKRYPVPFLLESIREGIGLFGKACLFSEDYEDPKVIYRALGTKGTGTIELRYPEVERYTKDVSPKVLEFLFGYKTPL